MRRLRALAFPIDAGEIGMTLQATISRLATDPDRIIVTM